MRTTETLLEARRDLEICNACRYCEGFCAVFPAMELRREFPAGDIAYLANLCHNCRGCYYACQYAPPHPFGLNMPKAFAELRAETYAEYAWPGFLADAFRSNGLVTSLVAALGLAGLLLAVLSAGIPGLFAPHEGPGAFYAVLSYRTLVVLAGASFLFAIFALAMSVRRFWRDAGPSRTVTLADMVRAAKDIATLKNLGGANGCNDRDEAFSTVRRRFHHFLFYGFVACFAATAIATLYQDVFGWVAPYPFFSLPVLLGTGGGIAMLIGCGGMLALKLTADPAPSAPSLLGSDMALLVLLALVALSGLLLLAFRDSGAMGLLLAGHVGLVVALFLLLPYSKMVHGLYRAAALLRNAVESRTETGGPAGSA